MRLEMHMHLRAASKRLAKERPGLVLMAAKFSGSDSVIPRDHAQAINLMAIEFVRAGWKPRLRVKAGRRVWSL